MTSADWAFKSSPPGEHVSTLSGCRRPRWRVDRLTPACFPWRTAAVTVLILALSGPMNCWAQVTLTGTAYTQGFNSIGSGLPTGWDVRTGASASALGTAVAFNSAKTTWTSTTGQFANIASANSPATFLDGSTTQGNDTDRAVAIQQTGSFGNPGRSSTFNFNASSVAFSGSGTALSVKLQDVNPAQGRLTTWSIQYGLGTSPTSWSTITTWNDQYLGILHDYSFRFESFRPFRSGQCLDQDCGADRHHGIEFPEQNWFG